MSEQNDDLGYMRRSLTEVQSARVDALHQARNVLDSIGLMGTRSSVSASELVAVASWIMNGDDDDDDAHDVDVDTVRDGDAVLLSIASQRYVVNEVKTYIYALTNDVSERTRAIPTAEWDSFTRTIMHRIDTARSRRGHVAYHPDPYEVVRRVREYVRDVIGEAALRQTRSGLSASQVDTLVGGIIYVVDNVRAVYTDETNDETSDETSDDA